MSLKKFDEKHLIEELKHYLPSQTPLKDFIHHNSLHAFQKEKFYDAIFKASEIFGFQATLALEDFRKLYEIGRISHQILERVIAECDISKEVILEKQFSPQNESRIGKLRETWKKEYHIDLDNLVQPLLFRLLGSYLDQGISTWDFPIGNMTFLEAIKELESNGFVSIFKTKRAKELLFDPTVDMFGLLKLLVGKEEYFEQYIFDQQFAHRGWSGLVASVEEKPETLLSPKSIKLSEVIFLELLLEIDNLNAEFGNNWQPLTNKISSPPINLFEEIKENELQKVLKIWQNAFEWSYYDEVLGGILTLKSAKKGEAEDTEKSFQAMFCIDERECSLRRHVENIDTNSETFGTPGFFSVEFYFQAQNAKFYDKLCPAPVTPKFLVKELESNHIRKHEMLYTKKTHKFASGYISTLTLGFWAGFRLVQNLFRPKMSPAISNAFAHMNQHGVLTVENKSVEDIENGLQIGFTITEMADRVESLLRSIGLAKNFAKLVYVVAHGSSSANNPHHGAHDCGACSGRPGSVNARVMATMANHPKVRGTLRQRGLNIPNETQFVGALHDTAADEIEFYDLSELNSINRENHEKNALIFERALDLNAKERSRRFASINTKGSLEKVRKAIKARSVSLFEPRPELGHGTNTLCIVGRRDLTKGLFLDRRAFLNSYDYQTDLDGKLLTGIMKPLGPVCGGINLEYYFSRVDNLKLGAGTKLPHNVVGLFGVANSSDGDLRPGLPWQMIEVHDPIRLLIIVEHFQDVVLQTIKSDPSMYEWFANEWVHLIALNPETHQLHYFKNGVFEDYISLSKEIHFFKDVHTLLENAKEMETNHIAHATQENLPIYLYN
jgi:uncharacterized protein